MRCKPFELLKTKGFDFRHRFACPQGTLLHHCLNWIKHSRFFYLKFPGSKSWYHILVVNDVNYRCFHISADWAPRFRGEGHCFECYLIPLNFRHKQSAKNPGLAELKWKMIKSLMAPISIQLRLLIFWCKANRFVNDVPVSRNWTFSESISHVKINCYKD